MPDDPAYSPVGAANVQPPPPRPHPVHRFLSFRRVSASGKPSRSVRAQFAHRCRPRIDLTYSPDGASVNKSNTWFLGRSRVRISNGTSIRPSAHAAGSPYFAIGREMSRKLAFLQEGSCWFPPTAWFLGPTRIHTPNGTRHFVFTIILLFVVILLFNYVDLIHYGT